MIRRLMVALILTVATSATGAGRAGAVGTLGVAELTLQQEIAAHLQTHASVFTAPMGAVPFTSVETVFSSAMAEDEYLQNDYSSVDFDSVSTSSTSATLTVHIQWRESAAQYAYVMTRLRALVDEITTPAMTDVEREVAIHDYLVLHLAYDTSQKHDTPYDALQLGITVCQGYAMMAYQMLKDAGIPVRIQDGVAGGGDHAWNMVRIGGNWYHLDVTWDDPSPDQPGQIVYWYFNLSDKQMRRDHSWTPGNAAVANTDFVTWLGERAAKASPAGAVARHVLKTTGLYLETAAYTYQTPAQLALALASNKSCSVTYRYPYGSVEAAMQQVNSDYRAEWLKDVRDPRYALVTFSHTCS